MGPGQAAGPDERGPGRSDPDNTDEGGDTVEGGATDSHCGTDERDKPWTGTTAQHSAAAHSTTDQTALDHPATAHSTTDQTALDHPAADHSAADRTTSDHSAAEHSTEDHSTPGRSTAGHSTPDHSAAVYPTAASTEYPALEHSATLPEHPRRGKIRRLLILGGLSAFGPLSIDMYLPALPRMAGDFQASDTTVQLTLTAFVIGLAVGQIIAGPLSDSFGRRGPLLVGLGLYIAGSVAAAVSPGVELLIAARSIQALGAAAGIVIARAAVRDLYTGTAMTKFFSLLLLVNGLAPILAPVLGGQLLSFTSWRGVFVVLTAFGALLLGAVAFALPEPLPVERRHPARLGGVLRTYWHLLTDRAFLGYALTAGLNFAALFAYISGSSFALQDVYRLSPQEYSVVFGLNGVGIVLAGQLNGWLVGRFPERTLLRTGLTVSTLSGLATLAAAALRLPLPALLVPLLLMVSCIGIISPNASSLALAGHARTAGAASALLGVLQFAIGGIATPLVGLGGPGTAVPMTAVMAGFGVLALLSFATLAVSPDRRDFRSATGRR
ncbi:Bicyclomycin resistance protein [Amycolatopsis sp. M39]|nr:Bicyclomycin resistance protein [Amycolatopsis sp. M39]